MGIKFSSTFKLLTTQKAMNGRKILDFILKYSIVLIILFPIIGFWYIMFYWGWFWMSSEVPWSKLTQTYLKIWDYSIWKQKWLNNVCSKNKEPWCLNWELLWIEVVGSDEAYIYFKLNYWTWSSIDKSGKRIDFYSYEIYKNKDRNNANSMNQIPKFWYLNWGSLDFYSEWDLDKLSSDKEEAFKELEKNPTIIMDGVNHIK